MKKKNEKFCHLTSDLGYAAWYWIPRQNYLRSVATKGGHWYIYLEMRTISECSVTVWLRWFFFFTFKYLPTAARRRRGDQMPPWCRRSLLQICWLWCPAQRNITRPQGKLDRRRTTPLDTGQPLESKEKTNKNNQHECILREKSPFLQYLHLRGFQIVISCVQVHHHKSMRTLRCIELRSWQNLHV